MVIPHPPDLYLYTGLDNKAKTLWRRVSKKLTFRSGSSGRGIFGGGGIFVGTFRGGIGGGNGGGCVLIPPAAASSVVVVVVVDLTFLGGS